MVYQLWLQDQDGSPKRQVIVECSNDLDAFDAAVLYLPEGHVEIWRGKTLIATLQQREVG